MLKEFLQHFSSNQESAPAWLIRRLQKVGQEYRDLPPELKSMVDELNVLISMPMTDEQRVRFDQLRKDLMKDGVRSTTYIFGPQMAAHEKQDQ